MNFTYNFVNIIDILGVIQGLLFGIMLILLQAKKNKPTLFLGLFIILFSLEPIPNILQDLSVLKYYPSLELFPVKFLFMAFPLLYIYIQKISILKPKNPSYWTLIPGTLEALIALVIFFLPVSIKLNIKDSLFPLIYTISGISYSIFIGALIVKWIKNHNTEIENQYSEVIDKKLHWSLQFTMACIIFDLMLLSNLFFDNHLWYIFISIINIILIYWVSFKGITQNQVNALVWNEQQDTTETQKSSKTQKLTPKKPLNTTTEEKQNFMSSEDVKEILETIEDYIENSKCFTKENLTIIDVAEAINIHPKRISYSLNSKLNANFNSFINSYRIEKAKVLLKSDSTKNLTVEGIGFEVGFHSKTSFYNAFRKTEGSTPAAYKNS